MVADGSQGDLVALRASQSGRDESLDTGWHCVCVCVCVCLCVIMYVVRDRDTLADQIMACINCAEPYCRFLNSDTQ